MRRAQEKAIMAGRLGEVGTTTNAPRSFDPSAVVKARPRRGRRFGPGARLGPGLVLVVALALVGAEVLVLQAPRARVAARPAAIRAPTPGNVTFSGVGYRLLGITAARTIPQPGAPAITASGLFEIVRLRLHAADRRAHVVPSDLLALTAGGTFYGASNPDDLGLSSKRWGALTPTTTVPASGGLTVRAIFDVPPGLLAHHPWLRIGQFAYVGQAPAQILRLADVARCCVTAPPVKSRSAEPLGQLVPNPVLG